MNTIGKIRNITKNTKYETKAADTNRITPLLKI